MHCMLSLLRQPAWLCQEAKLRLPLSWPDCRSSLNLFHAKRDLLLSSSLRFTQDWGSAAELALELKARGSARHFGITLQGANRSAAVSATEKSLAQSNYLLGNDPSRSRTQVPHFGRLTYADIYPGVDLTFYGKGQHLEHDFIVKPGTEWGKSG